MSFGIWGKAPVLIQQMATLGLTQLLKTSGLIQQMATFGLIPLTATGICLYSPNGAWVLRLPTPPFPSCPPPG